jgi:hypothetical protein
VSLQLPDWRYRKMLESICIHKLNT